MGLAATRVTCPFMLLLAHDFQARISASVGVSPAKMLPYVDASMLHPVRMTPTFLPDIRLRSCMRPASGRAAAPSVKAGAARILQLSEDEIAEHAMSVSAF
jgi:hypothetical protein